MIFHEFLNERRHDYLPSLYAYLTKTDSGQQVVLPLYTIQPPTGHWTICTDRLRSTGRLTVIYHTASNWALNYLYRQTPVNRSSYRYIPYSLQLGTELSVQTDSGQQVVLPLYTIQPPTGHWTICTDRLRSTGRLTVIYHTASNWALNYLYRQTPVNRSSYRYIPYSLQLGTELSVQTDSGQQVVLPLYTIQPPTGHWTICTDRLRSTGRLTVIYHTASNWALNYLYRQTPVNRSSYRYIPYSLQLGTELSVQTDSGQQVVLPLHHTASNWSLNYLYKHPILFLMATQLYLPTMKDKYLIRTLICGQSMYVYRISGQARMNGQISDHKLNTDHHLLFYTSNIKRGWKKCQQSFLNKSVIRFSSFSTRMIQIS